MGALPDLKPGERPAPGSDEAGLWMQVERVEEALRGSGRLVTDPALNGYVRGVACKVAGPYCADLRVYVVETPHVNASMAPNGFTQVWTGLLLRLENEAQLAAVLAHETAHYERRHVVQGLRDVRYKTNLNAFIQVTVGAAAYGFAGGISSLVTAASVTAFSREMEREADELSVAKVTAAGYAPAEASKTWENLVREREASGEPNPSVFLASHPADSERLVKLRALAERAADRKAGLHTGEEPFRNAMRGMRGALLRDELRLRQFARTQVVLDRLKEAGAGLGELWYYQGELHRLRAQGGDEEQAVEAYRKALSLEGAPAETQRALGLALMRRGDRPGSRAAFEKYLEVCPDAQDREMIRSHLEELK